MGRFKHWYGLFRRSVWPLIAIPLAVLGNLFAIRDEFLPPELAGKLKMPNWLPAFPWYYWTILVLVLIIVALLEGAYREHQALTKQLQNPKPSGNWRAVQAQNEMANALRAHTAALERSKPMPPMIKAAIEDIQHRNRIAQGLERNPNALRIAHESTAEFEEIQPLADHVARTVLICIENTDSTHFISNCKVRIEVNSANYLLLDSFTLNPTEKRFIAVATHHEFPVDEWIHLRIPLPGGSYIGVMQPRFPLSGALLTIKATSAETRPAQLICRVFVDESGKLKMEKV